MKVARRIESLLLGTDKENFQQWLVGEKNFTHSIHIKPNDYSDIRMRKYLSWVNYELNKTFLSRRFFKFKNQFDRFMFVAFKEFKNLVSTNGKAL